MRTDTLSIRRERTIAGGEDSDARHLYGLFRSGHFSVAHHDLAMLMMKQHGLSVTEAEFVARTVGADDEAFDVCAGEVTRL